MKLIKLNKLALNKVGLKAKKKGYIYLIPFTVREIVESLLKESIDKLGDKIKTDIINNNWDKIQYKIRFLLKAYFLNDIMKLLLSLWVFR